MSGRAYIQNIDMVFPRFGNTITLTIVPKTAADWRAIQEACVTSANNRNGFRLNLIEISGCQEDPALPAPTNIWRTSDPNPDSEEDAMAWVPLPAPEQPALPEMDEECPICGEPRSTHEKVIDICPFTDREKEVWRCPSSR